MKTLNFNSYRVQFIVVDIKVPDAYVDFMRSFGFRTVPRALNLCELKNIGVRILLLLLNLWRLSKD